MSKDVKLGDILDGLHESAEARWDGDPAEAVVSAAIAFPGVVADLAEIGVSEGSLARSGLSPVWTAARLLDARGEPLSVLTLANELRRLGKLEDIGGTECLAQLRSLPPPRADVPLLARRVVDDLRRTELVAALADLTAVANNEQNSVDDVFAEIEALSETFGAPRRGPDLGQHMNAVMRCAEHGPETADGSGFAVWDALTGGLTPGLHIVAGRTSQGKTAFALGLNHHRSITLGAPSAFYSLEMGAVPILQRLLSMTSGVRLRDIREGQVPPHKWGDLTRADVAIRGSGLEMHTPPTPTVAHLCSAIRRHGREGCTLVVIDQLSHIATPGATRHDIELKDITNQLQAVAATSGVAVVLLHQINRGVEGRDDRRPRLSDLRDASVEDSADTVTGLYRAEYYLRDETPEELRGKGEAIVLKNRNGPTGVARMCFDAPRAMWGDDPEGGHP